MQISESDTNTRTWKHGDLNSHQSKLLCSRFQLGNKWVETIDVSGMVAAEMVKVVGGFSDEQRDRVCFGVNNVGFGRFRRGKEGSGEREVVLEGEGERVLEVRESEGGEVREREREVEEEERLAWGEEEPWKVEESERKRGR